VTETARTWNLTQESLDAFLACLDDDRRRAGERYEQLRSKLINFFQWRGAVFPEDQADETINRVIRKLAEGESIRDPATYVYGVARMVVLEAARQRDRAVPIDEVADPPEKRPLEEEYSEPRLGCLDGCLQRLPTKVRELITEYYVKDKGDKIEHRKKLAGRLGIQTNALRIRALRTRDKLRSCIEGCMKEASGQMGRG
jgi:DNA-directed RNA polymerase specialized sigma24 family protein